MTYLVGSMEDVFYPVGGCLRRELLEVLTKSLRKRRLSDISQSVEVVFLSFNLYLSRDQTTKM